MSQTVIQDKCSCFKSQTFGTLLSTDRIDTENRRIASGIYRKIHLSTQEGYRLAFLLKDSDGETGPVGEFRSLHRLDDSSSRRNDWRLMLLILDPDGEPVRDAGVVFTLICPHNVHKMDIGTLVKAGYHFEFEAAHDGFYRVETEIVAKGQFLATDFAFEIFQGIGRSSC